MKNNCIEYSLPKAVDALQAYNCISVNSNIYLKLNFTPSWMKKHKVLDITLSLPHSEENNSVLAVLGTTEEEYYANQHGILVVGLEHIAESINEKRSLDHIICNTQKLAELQPYLTYLGSNNLLPSNVKGTLTTNVKEAIDFFKESSIFIKGKTPKTLYVKIGSKHSTYEMLQSNIDYVLPKILGEVNKNNLASIELTSHNSPTFSVSYF